MLKLKAIDHVTLFVRDVAQLKPYYERVFGFRCTIIEGDSEKNLQLETDTTHFFFLEVASVSDEPISKQHISFEVDSLEPVIRLLDASGEVYKTGRYIGFETRNYDWCEWLDPAGIRIECVQHL